ncbi:HAMP domain-containing sensor histidine kinase [Actinosynnema sp. NPDC047251]|uniref:Signal transduction histidine-protein kinase/phosphatase MprB n=1 Tax=Saccharothrix espanaensis (strain ATCC 51144 / DSM 44229 / JCM 9112 / NBRC 15066 / NRRL 15764) TaxID=1179773 RepID=K0JZ96_SACES|nr:HAMP domain-containing sensor histidine kinase [Saccharothrix espanaensis]CCH33315.1 putative histidine kinase [Saccharothrix espanaensis DSM 44229]
MRRSLALVSLAVTSMVAFAFLIPLAMVVQQLARDRAFADAELRAVSLTPVLAITAEPLTVEQALVSTGGQVAVHLVGGQVVGTAKATEEQLRTARGERRTFTAPVSDGWVHMQPVVLGEDRVAVVEAFVPEEELSRGVSTAWFALGGVALSLVLASVLVADRLGGRVVKASKALAEGAQRMEQGDLATRVVPTGPPELADAGGAFNRMADRIGQLMAAERELLADLSHRLRTPLTALRLDSETLGADPGANRVRQAVHALEREVNELIRAARRELDDPGGRQCDAAQVVHDRLVFWSALADDQQRRWNMRGTERSAFVPLTRTDLAAAMDVVLGNIFRHTPEGVGFVVALFHRPDLVVIVIEDAGPGIEDLESALRRGSSSAGSTGLGLDIARRAAESTGGSLSVDRGPLGGTRVQLRLTRVPEPQG